MGFDRTDASDHAAEARLPEATSREVALPFPSRPVFVIVGMHRSGAALLAKMLQLLGVDMAEGGGGGWERPEIVALNDRLLEIIGRPLGSAAHSLPFPAGWWGDPRVLALKREAQAFLARTLEGRFGLWGFKDLRTTRLLPFWQQLFDELGLRPIYLWAVREPAACAASAASSGLVASPEIGEAMWFIYNADAHKFVGDDAVAIVDYAAWGDAPEAVVQALLDRLPLRWRGSHGELLECVRGFTANHARHAPPSPLHSPLVQSFYEAIRDPERSDQSLRHRGAVAHAVDILRTLVSPFATLVSAADGTVPSAPVESDALAAAAARAAEAEATLRETEEVLTREIEARAGENAWLQRQYLDGKRALAEMEDTLRQAGTRDGPPTAQLRQELEASITAERAAQRRVEDVQAAAERQRKLAREELEQVRKELALQKTANEKYLSRIYELKATRRQASAAAEPAGAAE